MRHLLLAFALATIAMPALADEDVLASVRSDFDVGRQAIQKCAPQAPKPEAFAHCEKDAIWRPGGMQLTAVPSAQQWGVDYQKLMLSRNADYIATEGGNALDADVKNYFAGSFPAFCSIFAVDCNMVTRRLNEVSGN